jgi:hypothetical protein
MSAFEVLMKRLKEDKPMPAGARLKFLLQSAASKHAREGKGLLSKNLLLNTPGIGYDIILSMLCRRPQGQETLTLDYTNQSSKSTMFLIRIGSQI